MQSKRGQLRSRVESARRAILGDGLLERARAISLGLLSLTAAVGLAIVALALNQGWPLIAGSSIPPIPSMHQDVGEASIAAGAARGSEAQSDRADDRGRSKAPNGASERRGGGTSPGATPIPADSTELVVSQSTPAKPRDDQGDGGSDQRNPAPAGQPKQTPEPNPGSASPPAEPVSSAPVPSSEAVPTDPGATASEAPDESSTPPWSDGNDHAYGRSDEWDDHDDHDWDDDDWDDDDDDWDDDGRDWRGHDHRGHH